MELEFIHSKLENVEFENNPFDQVNFATGTFFYAVLLGLARTGNLPSCQPYLQVIGYNWFIFMVGLFLFDHFRKGFKKIICWYLLNLKTTVLFKSPWLVLIKTRGLHFTIELKKTVSFLQWKLYISVEREI